MFELAPDKDSNEFASNNNLVLNRLKRALSDLKLQSCNYYTQKSLGNKDDDSDGDDDDEKKRLGKKNQFQKIAGTGTFLTLLALSIIWWLKRKKKMMLANQKDSSSLHSTNTNAPVQNILTSLLNRKLNSQRTKNKKNTNNRSITSNREESYHQATVVPLSVLLSAAKKGAVASALINSTEIAFQLSSSSTTPSSSSTDSNISHMNTNRWKKSKLPKNSPNLTTDILNSLTDNGCLDISALPESFLKRLAPILINASPFIYLALLYQMMKRFQNGSTGDDMDYTSTDDLSKRGEQLTTFSDVAGVDTAQEELQEIINYLSNPKPFLQLGASPPRGVLLHGPPGNGKTLLARAIAGEARADYFLSCSGSDFVEVYVGHGAKRVREMFARARSQALKRWHRRRRRENGQNLISYTMSGKCTTTSSLDFRLPTAVIFIDEIDTLAKCRDGIGRGSSFNGLGGNDEREQTLNALLTEIDGFNTPHNQRWNKGLFSFPTKNDDPQVTIIVIAATNRLVVIDPALLRPGRFDRHVVVPPPTKIGREAIMKVHTRKVMLDDDVNLSLLSNDEYTDSFTGAELKNVINEAALLAVRQGKSLVNQENLLLAINRVKNMKFS